MCYPRRLRLRPDAVAPPRSARPLRHHLARTTPPLHSTLLPAPSGRQLHLRLFLPRLARHLSSLTRRRHRLLCSCSAAAASINPPYLPAPPADVARAPPNCAVPPPRHHRPHGNEFRCLKRTDLIKTLADNLPAASIHFGRHVVAIEIDTVSSFPILHINDGSIIKAKVLIGCDGSDSVVANSLGMGAPKLFQISAIRGFTSYPNGHLCGSFFLRLIEDNVVFGRIPVDNNLVYWFVARPSSPEDSEVREDPILIRDATLHHLRDHPTEITEMVQQSDLSSLSLARIKYRAPWQLMFTRKHWRGTSTVAGDAMHVMGPFMGQGGSAAMEDSVVLARCLAREIRRRPGPGGVAAEMIRSEDDEEFKSRVGAGLHSILVLLLFFGGSSLSHTRYDCGGL